MTDWKLRLNLADSGRKQNVDVITAEISHSAARVGLNPAVTLVCRMPFFPFKGSTAAPIGSPVVELRRVRQLNCIAAVGVHHVNVDPFIHITSAAVEDNF